MMWNASQQGSRHNCLIGKSATIKPAEHLQVLAGVAAIGAALTTDSTRQMRFRDDPLAWPEVGHFAANSQYLTAEFVAENNWELVGHGQPSPAQNLQISTANARCENAHMFDQRRKRDVRSHEDEISERTPNVATNNLHANQTFPLSGNYIRFNGYSRLL